MVYLAFGAAFLAILFVTLNLLERRRLTRLARSRSGQGLTEFRGQLEGSGVPDSIQRKIFEYVQENWASAVREFPVRADDNLLETYRIDTEEVEAAMLVLPELCGREMPLMSLWKGQPIGTVGDLARFVANLPTAEEIREEGVRRLWTNQ